MARRKGISKVPAKDAPQRPAVSDRQYRAPAMSMSLVQK